MTCCGLLSWVVLAGCLPSSVGTGGGSADPGADLMAAFRQAHASKDIEAILDLFCFDGADAEMRETVRGNVGDELLCPIKEIRIEPTAPGTHGPTVEGGIHWRPSLEVIALMTVDYDTSAAPPGSFFFSQGQHTVGQKGGRYYLTVPVRE
jgi:hypothetical protein